MRQPHGLPVLVKEVHVQIVRSLEPFLVLFDRQRPDQAKTARLVREYAHDVRAA